MNFKTFEELLSGWKQLNDLPRLNLRFKIRLKNKVSTHLLLSVWTHVQVYVNLMRDACHSAFVRGQLCSLCGTQG